SRVSCPAKVAVAGSACPVCLCGEHSMKKLINLAMLARWAAALCMLGASVPAANAQTGACCLPDGNCVALSGHDCAAASGYYYGDFTSCPFQPCGGACCLPDGSCFRTYPNKCHDAGGEFVGF